MGEITVILLLALIFLGPKKLPELASGLGKFIREFRKTTADVKNEIQLDDAIRKPFEELRDAVTLHPDELKRRDLIKQQMEEVRRQAEKLAKEVAAPAESPADPVSLNTGDATIVQELPSILPPPAAGEAAPPTKVDQPITPISAAPAGTVARGGQVIPAPGHNPASAVPPDAPLADSGRITTRPPLPAPRRRVVPPVSSASKGDTTQSLTEADLLTGAASTFPPPPPAPAGNTVKQPGGTVPPPAPSGPATVVDVKKSTT